MGAEPNDYDKHFKLMADIDLSGYVYDRAVIAPDVNDAAPRSRFQGTSFIGIFDGNGHTISHMTIVGGKYLGLFGMTRGDAVISDLCFEAVDVNGTGDWVGSLVGWNKGNASIINCHSSGKVTGKDYVGGLVGENLGGVPPQVSSIVASYSSGTVSGAREVGGLVGRNWAGGIITASYSSGSVNGEDTVGGLVGYGSWGISGCYSTGTVSGDENVGGLVGYGRDDANVMSSFWDVEASDQTSSAGGTGRTTAEMQTATTFLEAGWDFVGETENGTDDIWWILEGQDYPRLWWQWPLVQVVDDFESYNDIPSEEMGSKLIYLTWIDGFDNPEINGCVIGELFTPFWPPDPHGGSQTMPFQYNNSGQAHYSEATARTENLEIDQDWTKDGLQTLSIWFYGDPSNTPDPMYVALANNGGSVGTVFYDDLDAILRETWTEWTIPLTESSNQGVILTNVYTISIGFGDKNNPKSGGSGKVYFDDIRLYRSSP